MRFKELPVKSEEPCPMCGSTMYADSDGSVFCSSFRCRFGLRESVSLAIAKEMNIKRPREPKVEANG